MTGLAVPVISSSSAARSFRHPGATGALVFFVRFDPVRPLFSAAGFLVLCPLSLFLLPLRAIAETTRSEWMTIAVAGIFNAIGFYAITHAMRYLTISRANVINASQNAMCAVGAFLMFGEALSPIGLFGIGLTIAGLLTLDRK